MPKTYTYLRSRKLRGRWFHYYRRAGVEVSLGVHGLHPTDKRVFAAYAAAHARHEPETVSPPKSNTFAWGLEMYLASAEWKALADETRKHRARLLAKYREGQGDRPLHTITQDALQRALWAKGGNPAIHDLKALKPLFKYLHRLAIISTDPARGVQLDKPKSDGFKTATADDIAKFQKHWPVGTTERLIFDLALLTGAARADLANLSRKNVEGNLLTYTRKKTGVQAVVPMTPELRAVIDRTPHIAPALILTAHGKPFTSYGLGNKFGEASRAAGTDARLHSYRKACCVYWAEKGHSTHQIAAIAGHLTLAEVERYTKAADQRRMVEQMIEGL